MAIWIAAPKGFVTFVGGLRRFFSAGRLYSDAVWCLSFDRGEIGNSSMRTLIHTIIPMVVSFVLDTAYANGYLAAVERLLVESTMKGTRGSANDNVELAIGRLSDHQPLFRALAIRRSNVPAD